MLGGVDMTKHCEGCGIPVEYCDPETCLLAKMCATVVSMPLDVESLGVEHT
jgi:hypothetical protein